MSPICAVSEATSIESTRCAEVSGWDANGQFFTEIVELDTAEAGQSFGRLTHRVAHRSLIFIRPVNEHGDDGCDRGLPVANEVAATDAPDSDGRFPVRFLPCQPRLARRHSD